MKLNSLIDVLTSVGIWCSRKQRELFATFIAILFAIVFDFSTKVHFNFQVIALSTLFALSGLFAFAKAEGIRSRLRDTKGATGPCLWLQKINLFLGYAAGLLMSLGGGIGILLYLLKILQGG